VISRTDVILPGEEQETRAMWRLGQVRGLGPVAVKRLIDHFTSARAVWQATDQDLLGMDMGPAGVQAMRSLPAGDAAWHRMLSRASRDTRLDPLTGRDYPAILRHLNDPPPLLWSQGQAFRPVAPVVAIVGSRRCSEQGRRRAYRWAYELAARNVVVVSGLAEGIDAAAHQGALDAGGTTWAVLGTGIDRCYPAQHARMADAIRAQGMLLSEWPLGAGPEAWRFPLRNRVISALSVAVIVMDAGVKSGALGTMEKALIQGKDVFLVPGRPEDEAARGTNAAIAAGHGQLLTDLSTVWRFLDEAKVASRDDPGWEGVREEVRLLTEKAVPRRRSPVRTDSLKGRIRQLLEAGPRHPSWLMKDLACSREELDLALFDLEMGGRVETLQGHRVSWLP
jgi:DNA processing protein